MWHSVWLYGRVTFESQGLTKIVKDPGDFEVLSTFEVYIAAKLCVIEVGHAVQLPMALTEFPRS